jgi:carbamoyltransferase
MVVLGVSGAQRGAASALIVDGALVAAMSEEACGRKTGVPRAQAGDFPLASAEACLQRAALSPRDVRCVVFCDQDVDAGTCGPDSSRFTAARRDRVGAFDMSHATTLRVGRLHAHASQLRVALPGDGPIAILDIDSRGVAVVFERNGETLTRVRTIERFSRVVHELRRGAAALGFEDESFARITAAAVDGRPVYADALARGLWYVPGGGIERNSRILALVYADADADAGGLLKELRPMHVQVRTTRANLAASLVALAGRLACDIALDVADAADVSTIGLGGSLFSHDEVLDVVRTALGDRACFAPVPAAPGLAFGAAIAGGGNVPVRMPDGLSVGRHFSELDVKQALDAAHLDYVYEPVWDRIVMRASRLLSRGKLVGWFQGPVDFGARSLGGRSILCDPSSRYARENINRYLLQRDDNVPPPLVMTRANVHECLEHDVCVPYGLPSVPVRAEFRGRLQGGVSECGRGRVQILHESSPSRLESLLNAHRKHMDVPALLQVDLCGPDETVACTPRDALRTMYSSPLDALFIERFVLMKDYWLLRDAADQVY